MLLVSAVFEIQQIYPRLAKQHLQPETISVDPADHSPCSSRLCLEILGFCFRIVNNLTCSHRETEAPLPARHACL